MDNLISGGFCRKKKTKQKTHEYLKRNQWITSNTGEGGAVNWVKMETDKEEIKEKKTNKSNEIKKKQTNKRTNKQ